MPRYTSRDNVSSGVPLGGIGAGKLEMMPNGTLNFATFQNNWSAPLTGDSAGILGFHFGIFTECQGKTISKILQSSKIDSFPIIKKTEYEGNFPFARLKYLDKALPLKIELLSFSPFIPRNTKDSSLPGAVFKFIIKNPTKKKITTSLLLMGRNTIGNWGVGRFNVVSHDKERTYLTFKNGRKEPLRNDFSLGEMTMSLPQGIGELTYMGEWNMQGESFAFKTEDLRLDAWLPFSETGRLPNKNTKNIVEGESQELGGALALKFDLRPGQTKEIPVIYSWFFPTHTVGHMYSRWFNNSLDVSKYISSQIHRLYTSTKKWHDKLHSSSLKPWLRDALINNLYPLYSGTWYGKNGAFVSYESPIICPLMGTVDVRFYGSLPVAFLFPKLELNAMEMLAKAQRRDGYIPHDLGRNRVDLPSDGTTYYRWKDLASKFVLMCYRDYLITKDKGFLKKVYPNIKKAMEWEFSQDKNRDFLPDNEGQDQTFDLWNLYSTNSYTAGIFLAALLACIKIARLFKDKASEEIYREWFREGRKTFEKKLWNGSYFSNYVCSDKGCEDSCTAAQLSGQWYAHLLGLGYIADKRKIRLAIKSILKLNNKNSPYGLISSTFCDGRTNKTNLHSKSVFVGMSYAFACLCIYEGYKAQGLKIVKKIWDNFAFNIKTPWNQADLINPSTGKKIFGDYYMRNMVVWAILPALSKKDPKIRKIFKSIITP